MGAGRGGWGGVVLGVREWWGLRGVWGGVWRGGGGGRAHSVTGRGGCGVVRRNGELIRFSYLQMVRF